MTRVLLAGLIVVLGAATAPAQVEIVHQPAYSPGAQIRTVAEMKLDQTLVIAGMNVETAVESFTAVKETIGERSSDGKYPVTSEFEYYIINLETPAGKYAFDSNSPDASTAPAGLESLDAMFKALSRAKWVATFNDKPELESIEFLDDPFANLDEATRKEVSADRFKQDYVIQLARFPDKAVSAGDKWTRTEESQIGAGQTLTFEKEFEYLGTEESNGRTFDRIGVKSLSVKFAIGEGSPLPFKLDDSQLKIASSEGAMLYDRELKTITNTSEKVTIEGTLTFSIDINGQSQKLPSELELTIESKTNAEPPQ
jgi:hypothetical protein